MSSRRAPWCSLSEPLSDLLTVVRNGVSAICRTPREKHTAVQWLAGTVSEENSAAAAAAAAEDDDDDDDFPAAALKSLIMNWNEAYIIVELGYKCVCRHEVNMVGDHICRGGLAHLRKNH